MNTAQVSIELVLAGTLALSAFVLPFWRGTDVSQNLLQTDALVAALGMAYLFGVVFDKLADFVLSPMEHFLRLQEADERLRENPRFKDKDPFPQDKLEVRLRTAQDGRLEWMNSLRSRIRTSREVAVLGLPASLGIVMYTGLTRDCAISGGPACSAQWMYVFIVLNILFFAVAIWRDESAARQLRRAREESSEGKSNIPKEVSSVEKSDVPGEDTSPETRKRIKTRDLSRVPKLRKVQMQQAEQRMRAESVVYSLMAANSVTGMAVVAELRPEHSWIPFFGIGTLIFSLFALWAWYRITRTYIRFLARAGVERSRKKPREDHAA